MQDLNDKINNGGATAQGQLSADEWNEIPSEIQAVITSVGQALSGGDLTQLVKAIVSYSANGNFFADSGIADAYVLTALGAKQGLYAYGDGSRVAFVASFDNTGAATVNVSTLGVKDIKLSNGDDLSAGDITADEILELVYDLANDYFVLLRVLTDSVYKKLKADSTNLLINGGFDVPQRGLSFTAAGYTLDRWDVGTGSATNVWQQVVLAPINADFVGASFYMDWTKSVAGASLGNMNQKIENVYTAANKTVTLSFWARSLDGGGTDFNFLLQQNFGTAGSSSVTVTLPTFAIGTDTDWTYYEFTADVPAISGKTIGADSYLKLQISPINISDTFSIGITAVKLEIGSVATPYQARLIGEEEALCRRYYQEKNTATTIRVDANVSPRWTSDFMTEMRIIPSAVLSMTIDNGGATVVVNTTVNSIELGFTTGGAGTFAKRGGILLDAEL